MTDTGEYYDYPRVAMEDDRYRIPGTNIFSFSRWCRENEMRDLPRFQEGDVVAYLYIAEVTKVYEDCDGTPLYQIGGHMNGINEESLRPATRKEIDEL